MERRRFLKDSAVGAGTFMAGLGFGGLNEKSIENPGAMSSKGAQPGRLIEVPGTSYEVTDVLTTIPVSVALGKFLISATQLTQQEFEEIMGYNPSFHRGPDLPVENVTWWEAIRYCNLRANLGSSDTKSVERLVQDLKNSGTRPVGSYSPNWYGLYGMTGNVWEWCYDYFNPASTPEASYNPTGPGRGLARIVRGGSFVSTTSEWARGYRSSVEPDYKSRFTGFRVCRTVEPNGLLPAAHRDAKWFEPYNQPPVGYESSTGSLSSLLAGVSSASEWENRRSALEAKWLRLLGAPDIKVSGPTARLIETVTDQNYTGNLMYLQ